MFWLFKLWERLLNCFFVRKCVGCGRVVDAGAPFAICQDCTVSLANEGQTVSGSRYFVQAISAVPYTGATREAMQKFKFQNMRYYGNTFAMLLYEHVRNMDVLDQIDLVICVPMNPHRERFYNQAAIIAELFARMARLPFDKTVLEKPCNLPPLSHLGRHDRMKAVRGAFCVGRQADVTGKTIALVDDIFTSGATAGECARVLKLHGAKAVYVLTPCFAIDKNYHTTMTKAVNNSRETNL